MFDGTVMEFTGNNVVDYVVGFGEQEWRSSGLISFKENTANSLIYFDNTEVFHSLVPLHFQDNHATNIYAGVAGWFCASPCEPSVADCACENYTTLSWDIPSFELQLPITNDSLTIPLLLPASSPNISVPLILEASNGLRYGKQFIIQPPPSSSSNFTRLRLDVPTNATQVDILITRLMQLEEEATLVLRVDNDQQLRFFMSGSAVLNIVFSPVPVHVNQTIFQPQGSIISVSFPNGNKPDHTLSIHDPQDNHPLTDRSVSTAFVFLMEVTAEGDVVSTQSLQEIDFEARQLGNATFNLNNALSFISFTAETIGMEVNFTMFVEEQVIYFGGVEQVIAANTLKWSLLLSSWPFRHRSHSLQLHLSVASEDGTVALAAAEEEANGVWSFWLKTESTRILFNVLPVAMVDEGTTKQVRAEWMQEVQRLIIELPAFNHSLLLDPDVSLLLDDEGDDDATKKGEEEVWWKIVVPVLVLLVVAAAVAIVFFGTVSLRRKSRNRRRLVTERLAKASHPL
ncbi:hypothetical protein QOT17_007086 [Balamuthia mandrillaris]